MLGWRPTTATLVASVFVVAGFVLTAINWRFIALAAVATFLPGILRELGLLQDKDEFQLEAARRAGYHAFLAGGLFTFLMVAWFRSTEPSVRFPGALLENTLIVMWFTWLLSSLFSFWGVTKAAKTILLVFGGVWLLFNLLASEGIGLAILMQSLLAVPFFLLAFLVPHRRRLAGLLLLAAAVGFFGFFGLQKVFTEDPTLMGRIPVIVLFIGPLLASGIALLAGSPSEAMLQSE